MTASMVFKIIREGIFAALTGGFYFDTSQCHFINIVHIYLWILLFLLPFLVGIFLPNNHVAWIIYSISAGLIILIIKLITFRLHHLFDTSEAIEDESPKNTENPAKEISLSEVLVEEGANLDIESADQNIWVHHTEGSPRNSPVFPSYIRSDRSTNPATKTDESNESTDSFTIARSSRRNRASASQAAGVSWTNQVDSAIKSHSSRAATREVTGGPIGSVSASIRADQRLIQSKSPEEISKQLEALKEDVSRLPIRSDDFKPSTDDLALLENNPTRNNLNKALSRSRSSSQRHRASLRNANLRQVSQDSGTVLIGGLQGVINGVGTFQTNDDSDVRTVARSQSLRQAVVTRRLQQLPGRRTQSFRRDDNDPSVHIKNETNSSPNNPVHTGSSQPGQSRLDNKVNSNSQRTESPETSYKYKPNRLVTKASVEVNEQSLVKPLIEPAGSGLASSSDAKGPTETTQSGNSCESVVSLPPWLFFDDKSAPPLPPRSKRERTEHRLKSRTPRSTNTRDVGTLYNNDPGNVSFQGQSHSHDCNAPLLTGENPNENSASTSDSSQSRLRLVRRSCVRRRRYREDLCAWERRGAEECVRGGPESCCTTVDPNDFEEEINQDATVLPKKRLSVKESTDPWVQVRMLSADTAANEDAGGSENELFPPATHEDTSDGSIHYFTDENGQMMVYVFGDGRGAAFTRREWLERMNLKIAIKEENSSVTANAGVSESPVFQRPDSPHPDLPNRSFSDVIQLRRTRGSRLRIGGNLMPEDSDRLYDDFMDQPIRNTLTWDDRTASIDQPTILSDLSGTGRARRHKKSQKRTYYRLQLFPWFKKLFKIQFDRLELSSLFDRNITWHEVSLSVFLSMMVAILGCAVISQNCYLEISFLIFCSTMCGCQYSLVKSVQPDSSTPQHGFNRIIVFSRAIYFSLLCSVFLLADVSYNYCAESTNDNSSDGYLYSVSLNGANIFWTIREITSYVLLALPLMFVLGFLPQINTFSTYVFEQIDIHVFGASGTAGVLSVLFSLLRSLVATGLVFILCFKGIERRDPQHVLFSVFWGVQLAMCYFLSRLPSDISLYMNLRSCCKCSKRSPVEQDAASKEPSYAHERESLNPSIVPTTCGDSASMAALGPSADSLPRVVTQQQPTSSATMNSLPPTNNQTSFGCVSADDSDMSYADPLPGLIRSSILSRLKNDAVVCLIMSVLGFAVHVSTAFTTPVLKPNLYRVSIILTCVWGFCLHYVFPQLKKPHPWLLLAKPVISSESDGKTALSEIFFIWLLWIERNILVPLVTMTTCTQAAIPLVDKFGPIIGSFIIIVGSMKLLRNGFQCTNRVYSIIFFTYLLFNFDYYGCSETFPVDYFFVAILYSKLFELLQKLRFVFVYIAPLQISWGSAFHALAQLCFVPHSMFLLFQCLLSSVISSPLEPFLASAIFLTSYVRPIKFWEDDYRTKRAETTNLSLVAQVEGTSEAVSENLNAIFYEHLTRSLQKHLAGDILMGRWGVVEHGDVFIVASEDLHFLVHIIEIGNGLVTFQLRGLEFVGTYCHEQETEELRTDLALDDAFCCCNPGHPPGMLSLNAAFHLRWVAWEVLNTLYYLDGYRVSDHSATTSLQLFDLRKLVIMFYVQCIIYYTASLANISQYLSNLAQILERFSEDTYVDLDPIFGESLDGDYDTEYSGVSRRKFVEVHLAWIQYCVKKRKEQDNIPCDANSPIVSLCFALSLLGRRCLGGVSPGKYGYQLEFFLHGIHSIFKGDIRVMTKDDWVFTEIDLLKIVIVPAVRIAIKLYQDQFACANLTMKHDLYMAIRQTEKNFVICHETHPMWRFAVLNDADSLFSFRRVCKVANDGYRIIMLSKKKLQFRVVKINSECVRGLWAGQQQEQIFLRNNDPERGSIQHARQVLRNLINSSCDLPIGYPIFVSPLTTSFAGTNSSYSKIAGEEVSLNKALSWIRRVWFRLRWHCSETCFTPSGESIEMQNLNQRSGPTVPLTGTARPPVSGSGSCASGMAATFAGKDYGSKSSKHITLSALIHQSQPTTGIGDSTADAQSVTGSAISGATAADKDSVKTSKTKKVKIVLESQVLNDKHSKLVWPNDEWRHATVTLQTSPVPLNGLEGQVVHKWSPSNPDITCRSFCHLTIVLVRLTYALPNNAEQKYALVYENGLQTVEEDS